MDTLLVAVVLSVPPAGQVAEPNPRLWVYDIASVENYRDAWWHLECIIDPYRENQSKAYHFDWLRFIIGADAYNRGIMPPFPGVYEE